MLEGIVKKCEGTLLQEKIDGKKLCRISGHDCKYLGKDWVKIKKHTSYNPCLYDEKSDYLIGGDNNGKMQ